MPLVKDGSVVALSHDGQHVSQAKVATRGQKRKESQGGGGEKPVSPLKFLADEDEDQFCGQCKKLVGNSGKCVACDRCGAWFHLGCSDLTSEDFKFLHRLKNTSIQWFCRSCKQELSEGSSDDRFAKQDVKLNQVYAMVKELKAQNEMILNKLNEDKLDGMVKAHVQEQLDTKNEEKERKNNLIIFNLKECVEDDVVKQRAHDKQTLVRMIEKICPEVKVSEIDEANFVRLGRKDKVKNDNDVKKNRPVKLVLPEEKMKGKILKKAKGLKNLEEFRRVGIAPDKTMKERMVDKKLRTELLARKKDGEDAVIFNGKVMFRVEIEEEKKRMKGVVSEGVASGGGSESENEEPFVKVVGKKGKGRRLVEERGQGESGRASSTKANLAEEGKKIKGDKIKYNRRGSREGGRRGDDENGQATGDESDVEVEQVTENDKDSKVNGGVKDTDASGTGGHGGSGDH